MGTFYLLCLFAWVLVGGILTSGETGPSFDQNYHVVWGSDHVRSVRQGREVRLAMDKSSGSGIASKLYYGSGIFHMRIKLPGGDTAGVVTAFYLTSGSNAHDELDFEFLGNLEGQPWFLQTNVFTNGLGNREQRIRLWYDPAADFHLYSILWNEHQIVFFVDKTPIRVFNNKENIGVGYPSQAMQVVTTLWDAEDWATDGGQIKTNWTQAPFKAYLQGFDINGCPSNITNSPACHSTKYWWNREQFWSLNPNQQSAYADVKKNYMTYDYCLDTKRFEKPPPECPQ
ncbi:hypothetical protein NE237_014572 [Protea cynaroides]|uniref:Xyloglucan endotransglucosylase/hydrolase n=1 Tax=Protea cynaroides TaxID=273540 RepID=A0A9Q0KCB4_9MAGN|nr:hypothetical protein NE237_014572 [Protea cynaroides]